MNPNKVVLITGTSSGLGLHTAVRAAQAGFQVVATMRQPQRGAGALLAEAARAGVTVELEELDVQSRSSIEGCVARSLQAHGRIDVLVNNAGYGTSTCLELASERQIQDLFDVNCFGAMRCIQAVLPHMRKSGSGHIITISSVAGLAGRPTNELYCAAKFALEGLMEGLATYLEPYFGIHCSLVEPADIRTHFTARILQDMGLAGDLSGAGQEAPLAALSAGPLREVLAGALGASGAEYAPILMDYLGAYQGEAGGLAHAQSAQEVAEVVLGAMLDPRPRMRYLSSDYARQSCAEKLAADPDGELQKARMRALLLGLSPHPAR